MKRKILFFAAILLTTKIFSQSSCINIGMNMPGPSYYESGANPFIDQCIYQGPFFTSDGVGWNSGKILSFGRDANGYVNSGVPQNILGQNHFIRHVISADGRINTGQYVFLYDGTGQFSFGGGITVDSSFAGRKVLTIAGTGNLWINTEISSPAPDHVRNFRLIPKAEEFTYQQNIFRQNFVSKVVPFNAIRYMDLFKTNEHPNGNWNLRCKKTNYTQTDTLGISYEWAISMSNKLQKHAWVNIPHLADSSYIANMAKLFHDSLNSSLKVYVEYSNEVWNAQFKQYSWINNGSGYPAWWGTNPLYNGAYSQPKNCGLHFKRVFEIWKNVFAADSARVIRVLATQNANTWVATNLINIVGNNFDLLSPACYFGISPSQAGTFTAFSTATDVIDSITADFYNKTYPRMLENEAIALSYNKNLAFYEGGQHVSAYGNASNPGLPAFYAAQTDFGMYQLYTKVLDTLKKRNYNLFMAFTLAGSNSPDGSWGHITDVDSIASISYSPKYMALINSCSILPIRLLTFTGTISANQNVLNWTTTSEVNNKYFDVEKSIDGSIFLKIATVNSSITPSSINSYRSVDNAPVEGWNYYRLKQVDIDGKFTYSNIIRLKNIKALFAYKIYPNPFGGQLVIELPNNSTLNTKLLLINTLGQSILTKNIPTGLSQYTLQINDIPNGSYLLKIIENNKSTILKSQLVIKQ
jgi:hypothetical protein